jgi:integrase
VATIFVRHRADCPHRKQRNSAFYRGCDCAKWLRYSGDGCFCKAKARLKPHKQHKLAADTRSWTIAEDKRAELQAKLDSRETGSLSPTIESKRQTVAQAVDTFITAKQSENATDGTIRKLRSQLGMLEEFLAERSKFFPADITPTDLIEFRASWTWPSTVTRQKAQQNVRAFLRSCCKENLNDLLGALKTIRLQKVDIARLEPQPFTESELRKLLVQVSKTFAPEPDKAAKLTTLIKFMVSTGVAIRDAVQLERANITDGWLRIKRQKTNRPVEQKLDAALHRELLTVANSNPRFIFWNGTSRPTSATGLWQTYMRRVMKDANLWIEGNLFHRFRDTAVDYWLGAGCSVVEIAAMLGDTVPVVERHYRKLLSVRMAERLAKIPMRSWSAANV